MNALEQAWYRESAGWATLLLPLAWLYAAIVAVRRWVYRRGWLASAHPGVPVIVVGNLTVGGTGKTPLVGAIARQLRDRGRRPGIVSRGYGGGAGETPVPVTPDARADEVGDEPLLLARRIECPVVVCRHRVRAARYLVSACGVDVVIADDGLQHYALARDAEIAVRDGRRGYGNGRMLPAGPLREPLSRLATVDFELTQGAGGDFTLQGDLAHPVAGAAAPRPLAEFAGNELHAVAGIGDPERFFDALRGVGLTPQTHAFGDHHAYAGADLAFPDGAPVLMTEKDAVKCAAFAQPHWWYLPITAGLGTDARDRLEALYDRILEAR